MIKVFMIHRGQWGKQRAVRELGRGVSEPAAGQAWLHDTALAWVCTCLRSLAAEGPQVGIRLHPGPLRVQEWKHIAVGII